MGYDRYKMTFKGADNSAGSVGAMTVELWFYVANDDLVYEGETKGKLGGISNNTQKFREQYRIELVEFGYQTGTYAGHDYERYALYKTWLKKKYKWIASVTGPDKIGSDGVTQMWTEAIADGDANGIPIMLTGIDTRDPNNGTKEITITVQDRRRATVS